MDIDADELDRILACAGLSGRAVNMHPLAHEGRRGDAHLRWRASPPGPLGCSYTARHTFNGLSRAIMADVEEVEVVVAHNERATLRVGDVFLKVDADQSRLDAEVEAMALAPIPTPEVLWRKPPVLALAAVPGTALGQPRRAVDRVAGGVGGGGCRRAEAARRAAAAMAGTEPRGDRRSSIANASGSSPMASFPPTS